MGTWSIYEAKARFSELVNSSIENGPQYVTRHGTPTVVVLPVQEFLAMQGPRTTLREFLLSAPRVDLSIERSIDPDRVVDL